MRPRLLDELEGSRPSGVLCEDDEDVVEQLGIFALEQRITAGEITAVGAMVAVTLAYWDPDDLPAVVSKRDASVLGGHLRAGRANPLVEATGGVSPGHLPRHYPERLGAAVIGTDGSGTGSSRTA